MKINIQFFFLFVMLLLLQKNSIAQPFSLDDRIAPRELTFEEYRKEGADKPNGRISFNKITQDADTSYYFIKGLSMYSATYFSLNSTDPTADIKINLCKENWHTVHQTGDVKGKGIWKTNFKTEGDFGIMVVANKKPAHYGLMVWTGNDLKVELPSVFKNADGVSSGSGWFKKNMTFVIVIAAALLIITFLLIKLKKKKS